MFDVNENCVHPLNGYPFARKPIDNSLNDGIDHTYDLINRQDIYRLVANTPTTSTRVPPPLLHRHCSVGTDTTPVTSPLADNFGRRPRVPNMNQTAAPITLTPDSPIDANKPVYVYYPNYSLPDLSFLQQILDTHSNSGQQKVYISPTSHQLPERDSVSVKMREKSSANGSKRRLKSLNDFESFCKQNLHHIDDWDSLNILLPNEFKELIQKANNGANETINEMSCDSHISEDSLESDTTPSNSVRMRSHTRSYNRMSNNNSYANKRLSLQDYPYSRFGGQKPNSHTTSADHKFETSFMHRSETMPNCRNSWQNRQQSCCHNSCNCHQHCCHNSCHNSCHQSCCHTSHCHSNHSCGDRTPQHSPVKSYNKTCSDNTKSSSIDKLCHMLATDMSLDLSSFDMDLSLDMDLTYDMDINGQNGWSDGLPHTEKCGQRMPSNSKQLVANENNKRVVSQLPAKMAAEDGSNFKELKQRWESMAGVSPSDLKPNSTNNSPKTGLNRKANNSSKVANGGRVSNDRNKSAAKVEASRKPQVVLRRPQTSSIPRPTSLNTENPKRSHRKSMIPVPTGGPTKSPVNAKVKSNAGFKP